jgi:hypothetical protein
LVLGMCLSMQACSPRDEPTAMETQAAAAVDASPVAAEPPRAAEAAAESMAAAPSADLAGNMAGVRMRQDSGQAGAPQARRFVAVRHQMQVEAPADQVAGAWAAVRDACGRLDCELVSAQLQRETAQTPVSAMLSLRVAPGDHDALLAAMGGGAKVINHSQTSEDKTAQVVDVEAHIRNRSEYRDSLRELLAERNVKRTLSELFEIRDTLSRVQAEIDSALTQRKLLEQETAKQFVQMQFRAEHSLGTPTHYSPWRELWRDAARQMADSARALVGLAAAVLPWALALLVLLAWPVRAWLRRR